MTVIWQDQYWQKLPKHNTTDTCDGFVEKLNRSARDVWNSDISVNLVLLHTNVLLWNNVGRKNKKPPNTSNQFWS
jgi:hypothetical protein